MYMYCCPAPITQPHGYLPGSAGGVMNSMHAVKHTNRMKIIPAQRKSTMLTPSSLACLSSAATINLTAGCAHGCLYCYARGYSSYPGDRVIRLYANAADKLRDELSRKRRLPSLVHFSSSSDLFQPVPEVLDLAFEVLGVLFEFNVRVSFLTKGQIPRRHMELLTSNATRVRANIGIITVDDRIHAALEPRTAPPTVRLAQARQLATAGIATSARVDPILPGLTDDVDSCHRLCSALAEAGITSTAAGVLFLRPAIANSLRRNLRDRVMRDALFRAFASSTRLSIRAESSSVTALPADDRRAILQRLTAVAQRYGIAVRVCACKNPDIARGSCHIAGDRAVAKNATAQFELFR